jgi:hypothetical protein
MRIQPIHPRGTSRVLLRAVKSYDMGPPTLLPIREEGVLRIFIVLKNPSPWPGSNPTTLGLVASTLTTTPPRRLGRYCIQTCSALNMEAVCFSETFITHRSKVCMALQSTGEVNFLTTHLCVLVLYGCLAT